MSVNKILDPGFSRLTLYSAVLMYELHSAILELIDRKIIPENATEEARSLLNDTVSTLEHEPINSAGSVLKTLAKKSLHEIETKNKEK